MPKGFLIAAPSSGSGKTLVTLGLIRAFARRGMSLVTAKAGPDYIDPAFHAVAGGRSCCNLDPWAMRPELIRDLSHCDADQMLIVEAMMGLFDGAADGTGSAADLAEMLSLPVILVVDCSRQSHSIAALVSGFVRYRESIQVAGVILNRVGSPRHEQMLQSALEAIDVPVVGTVFRDESLAMPSRHLGLVQAGETDEIEGFIDLAADKIELGCDLAFLAGLGSSSLSRPETTAGRIKPLGQRIAIAKDQAFSFLYPHLLRGWQAQGTELTFFSPLANEAPSVEADAIFLPGGYPELHGGILANNSRFLNGTIEAAKRQVLIYAECGGYMVLGDGLIDGNGVRHKMAGLLPLTTSFAKRRLHLGYRRLVAQTDFGMIRAGDAFTGHEFHYSTIEEIGTGEPLFHACDAQGADLGLVGQRRGSVVGSYIHLIDRGER